MAELVPADLMQAIARSCPDCWKADHAPAAADDLDGYVRALRHLVRHDLELLDLAAEYGYDGTGNDLRYAAHREMYARGDDAQMARMMRHVRDASAGN